MREHCHRCRKPARVCICSDVPRIDNQTEVLILQHPKEREHPFGTARFAELGLERVRTYVHHGLGRSPSPLPPLPEGTALIYPSQEAPELSPESRPRALLFLDGTWAQSRTLYRINPALEALPHYRLEPRVASRYRIRGEPASHCTSTIEAIALSLAIVEPKLAGIDRLIAAFESMIARQVDFSGRPHPRRKKDRPPPKSRALPDLLFEGRRLILAHGELSHDELVYLAASDLEGRTFECAIRPEHPMADWWVEQAGVDRTIVMGGVDQGELARLWRDFAGQDDVLATWNVSMLRRLATCVDRPNRRIALKTAYCNLRSSQSGTLDEVIRREGLTPITTGFMGRTGRIMARLIAVARWMTER